MGRDGELEELQKIIGTEKNNLWNRKGEKESDEKKERRNFGKERKERDVRRMKERSRYLPKTNLDFPQLSSNFPKINSYANITGFFYM